MMNLQIYIQIPPFYSPPFGDSDSI